MFFSNCCWMKELAIWSQTGNSCHPQLKKNLVVLTAFSFLITLAYINFQDVSVLFRLMPIRRVCSKLNYKITLHQKE